MKKSLLALAVLGAFAGAAQAQSAVTIYGSFDAGLRHTNPAAGSNWTMSSNGTFNNNRLGFKGVEDLGGGLNAHFNLETGFNSGTGQLDTAATTNKLFNRSAFVGLGGSWGSLDFGRQYSVNFKTIGSYDPFGYKYTAIIPLATQGGLTRLDNDVQYTYTTGPITARAEYAFGENAGAFSQGATRAIGATYASGPITVGGAYTRQNQNNAAAAPVKNFTFGGAYSIDPLRVSAGYAKNSVDGGADDKLWWLGASYNATAEAAVTAGYFDRKVTVAGADTKGKLFIVGGTYALSKRTNLYADIDYTRTTPPAGAQTSLTGFSAGINHLF